MDTTNKKNIGIEIFGWYGAVAIILAYLLVSFQLVQPTSPWNQALNLTGAIGIVCVSLSKKNYQPVLINIVWTIIALVALIRIFLS